VLSGCASEPVAPGRVEHGRVATVADGDTLRLSDGRRIRLVQIDAPERGQECFGERARLALLQLAPPGSEVALEREPSLDDHDRFGRLLRTVRVGDRNVNLARVSQGAAAPYFYRGARGRGSAALLEAAERARDERRGLWGSCPRARLRPTRAVDSGSP
jgi:endonuclease YncB( thermonuclease family)